MGSLFSQLYMGCLPSGISLLPTTEEYQQLQSDYRGWFNQFYQELAALSPELETRFTRLIESNTELQTYECEAAFQYGLSLGLLLMAEAVKYLR